jgi:hypothetical protein
MVTRRHHAIRDVIVSMVTKAGGKATEEPGNFHQAYGDEKRSDILVNLNGRLTLVDVVVTNPLAATYLRGTIDRPLSAAEKAARKKTTKYAQVARDSGASFVPFSLEVYGGFEAKAVEFVKTIATHGAAHSPHLRHEILEDLVGGVSVAIQRGNWNALVHSVSRHMRLPA